MSSNERDSADRSALYRPTASLAMLRLRAELLGFVREFFNAHGFWEVETPLVSRDVVVDAYLDPFLTFADDRDAIANSHPRFLQTSPEFGMKRLLAHGASAIFQVTRAFRRGELGLHHNPEFTILEWYRVASTYQEQMAFVEDFVAGFLERIDQACKSNSVLAATIGNRRSRCLERPFARLSYDTAFTQVFGRPVIGLGAKELSQLAESSRTNAPASLASDDIDGWLNLLLATKVEPELSRRPAVFIYDYPPGQAALAQIRHGMPAVAERFELYLSGIEICNGYQELTDPGELRRRITAQSELRQRDGSRALPTESRLLEAMEAGLPECAGVALGFDRLLMAAVGAASLADVMAFPFERA